MINKLPNEQEFFEWLNSTESRHLSREEKDKMVESYKQIKKILKEVDRLVEKAKKAQAIKDNEEQPCKLK